MQAALNLRLDGGGRGQGAAIGVVNIFDGVIRSPSFALAV